MVLVCSLCSGRVIVGVNAVNGFMRHWTPPCMSSWRALLLVCVCIFCYFCDWNRGHKKFVRG
jgi:hypothetical protein